MRAFGCAPPRDQLLWKVQGTNRRFFVGAYAGEGIPLLEGCVESGLRVAKMFGVDESLIYRLESVRPVRRPRCPHTAPDRCLLYPRAFC